MSIHSGDRAYPVCVCADFEYQRKEPLYFWFYFATMNSIWIVCPLLVISQMLKEVSQAVALASNHK